MNEFERETQRALEAVKEDSHRGLARRFIREYPNRVILPEQLGEHHVWDGQVWRHDPTGARFKGMVKNVVNKVEAEYNHEVESDRKSTLGKILTVGASSMGLSGTISYLADDLLIDADQLDQYPTLLNLQNCVLDLETLKTMDHDPDLLLTSISPTSWDPEATCPTWDQTMEWAFPDVDRRTFAYTCWFYALMGGMKDYAIEARGETGRGKTSILEHGLGNVLGPDYFSKVPYSAFTLSQFNNSLDAGALDALAKLRGARFALISEPPNGVRVNEAIYKAVVRTGRLTVKHMRQRTFDMLVQFLLVADTNWPLFPNLSDDAVKARVIYLPFEHDIPEDRKESIRLVEARLKAERDGMLHRIAEVGGRAFWENGGMLSPPADVLRMTEEYLGGLGWLKELIERYFVKAESATERVTRGQFNAKAKIFFQIHMSSNKDQTPTSPQINKKMKDLKFEKVGGGSGSYDLKFQDPEGDLDDPEWDPMEDIR